MARWVQFMCPVAQVWLSGDILTADDAGCGPIWSAWRYSLGPRAIVASASMTYGGKHVSRWVDHKVSKRWAKLRQTGSRHAPQSAPSFCRPAAGRAHDRARRLLGAALGGKGPRADRDRYAAAGGAVVHERGGLPYQQRARP